jgi:hypothetical protein
VLTLPGGGQTSQEVATHILAFEAEGRPVFFGGNHLESEVAVHSARCTCRILAHARGVFLRHRPFSDHESSADAAGMGRMSESSRLPPEAFLAESERA